MRTYSGGKFRCAKCPPTEYCFACRDRYNKLQNSRYAERRAKSLCTWCGEPTDGRQYCEVHRLKRQKWLAEKAAKEKRDRINGGLAR